MNEEHFKKQAPSVPPEYKLGPSWRSRQGQTEASRLTTFFEIRGSRWEITVTGGQAKDCLSGPAASRQALLCQNCPCLHPRGRLMQDESSVCSMRFQHTGLSSNRRSKNTAVPHEHTSVSFRREKVKQKASFQIPQIHFFFSARSISGNTFMLKCPF